MMYSTVCNVVPVAVYGDVQLNYFTLYCIHRGGILFFDVLQL